MGRIMPGFPVELQRRGNAPSLACFDAKAICSALNFDFLTVRPYSPINRSRRKLPFQLGSKNCVGLAQSVPVRSRSLEEVVARVSGHGVNAPASVGATKQRAEESSGEVRGPIVVNEDAQQRAHGGICNFYSHSVTTDD